MKTVFRVSTLAFLLLFGSQKSFAQDQQLTFKIISNGTATDIKKYEDALKKADMESYRYKTHRCVIQFDDGVKAELFSAMELISMGMKINGDNYSDNRDPKYIQPTFHLTDAGTLVAMYPAISPK